ncbi:peptidoglycan-binding protein [Streptomyces roseifaciens]
MKIVTRTQLGWPASAAPDQATTLGVKIHYEGSPVSTQLLADHDECIQEWKDIRASHLANTQENYSDIAYNYGACPHGYLLEGRGLGKRTGANGNQALNRAHYAICGLVGSSGLIQPTDAMLHAIRDGIELLRQHGADAEIRGHRDGYPTECPGGPLYAWVQKGAPRPGGTPPPSYEPFPGAGFFHLGQHSRIITEMGKRLVAEGCSRYQIGPGPDWSEADRQSYASWQRRLGYSGDDADGIPGSTSWAKLRVPHV